MRTAHTIRTIALAAALALGTLALPGRAFAHCDTMDGPVVLAAQQALQTGELEPMLIWVRAHDEPEIRHAFEHVQRVRRLGGDAAALADRFFFETVVRLHREGEGEPYTGLKPAGTDVGRAVTAGDRALESGSLEELRQLLHSMVDERLEAVFSEAHGRRGFAPTDVAAGREYVEAYVQFMHFGELLEALASGHAHHGDGGQPASAGGADPGNHAH
jgi:hypothetical protein